MATLFIATDFSTAAENATQYGLALAKALGAHTILFNGYKVTTPAAGLGTSVSRFDLRSASEGALISVKEKFGGNDDVEICEEEGADTATIIEVATEKKADLIIVGMKGKGQAMKKLFGSTALSLARESSIPVLIVPETAAFHEVRTVVLAVEQLGEKLNLEPLAFLEKDTALKYYVVHVDTAAHYDKPAPSAPNDEPLTGESNVFYKSVGNADVTEGLQEFMFTHNAQVLGMQPHKYSFFENVIGKSETKEMLFASEFPILTLPSVLAPTS